MGQESLLSSLPSKTIADYTTSNGTVRSRPIDEGVLLQIRDALHGLRYGSVNVIVQDGFVLQIDRTEKKRLRSNREATTM